MAGLMQVCTVCGHTLKWNARKKRYQGKALVDGRMVTIDECRDGQPHQPSGGTERRRGE